MMLNDIAIALTGWDMSNARGQPLESVFHVISESTREPLDNPAQGPDRARHRRAGHHALLIARDGSERPIADSAAPIRDARGDVTGAVLVFRDVTETRRLEEQYRQSQKMEAIGRFAGGIAHDFNNLLTVINGYCQMMETDCEMSTTFRDYLNEVHHAGNRAAALTQQLLAFGRNAANSASRHRSERCRALHQSYARATNRRRYTHGNRVEPRALACQC